MIPRQPVAAVLFVLGASLWSPPVGAVTLSAAVAVGDPAGGGLVKAWDASGSRATTPVSFAALAHGLGAPRVASGDVDGDGLADLVVGTPAGVMNRIRIFDANGNLIGKHRPFWQNYYGGVDVAAGDVDGDGQAEVIACRMKKKSEVKVIGPYGTMAHFFPWNGLGTGCRVSAGDVDGDGRDEILVASGGGMSATVSVFSADGTPWPVEIHPLEADYQGAVDVVAADLNGDGTDDVTIVRNGPGAVTVQAVMYLQTLPVLLDMEAFGAGSDTGGSITSADLDGDGDDELLVSTSAGASSTKIRAFDGAEALWTVHPFGQDFFGGSDVAGFFP